MSAAGNKPSSDDLFPWQRESYHSGFPGHSANTTGETSYHAARDIAPKAKRYRELILSNLRDVGPASSTELARRLGVAFDTVQPRTSELRRDGLIEDSGARSPTQYGKLSIVWRAVR
jgi:hypothetical protein